MDAIAVVASDAAFCAIRCPTTAQSFDANKYLLSLNVMHIGRMNVGHYVHVCVCICASERFLFPL